MNQINQSSVDLSAVLRVLRRRIVVVMLCVLLVPASALAFSLIREKQYSASASLLFRDPQLDQKLFGSTFLAPSNDPDREAATNVKLVSLDVVAQRTERLLPKVGSVSDKVVVAAAGKSNVASVMATDADPETAARIANTFAAQYIAFRRGADRAKIRDAQRLVRRQLDSLPVGELASARGRSIRQRSEQLQVLASLQTGNAELVERATAPSSPSAPRVARNTALGAGVGMLLGAMLALLLERLDRRIRDPKELEEIFDRPILAAVPESQSIEKAGGALGTYSAEMESFRMLRANLRYFNVDRDIKSVLVTSAAPGDGKSTVAWNLASAAGGAGARALLIEADLRHPRFASRLGFGPSKGLSTVLAGESAFDKAVQQIPVSQAANGRAPRTFDVLVAGPLPPNPADLLESDRMRDLLSEAEDDYDFVVIDTPPTAVVPDAIPLVPLVGGVIVVGRVGQSTRDAVVHLRNQLQNLDAPTLGVVANALKSGVGGYGYAYGYAYGSDQAATEGENPGAVPLAGPPGGEGKAPEGDVPEQKSAVTPS